MSGWKIVYNSRYSYIMSKNSSHVIIWTKFHFLDEFLNKLFVKYGVKIWITTKLILLPILHYSSHEKTHIIKLLCITKMNILILLHADICDNFITYNKILGHPSLNSWVWLHAIFKDFSQSTPHHLSEFSNFHYKLFSIFWNNHFS